jgi:hypothetical protein
MASTQAINQTAGGSVDVVQHTAFGSLFLFFFFFLPSFLFLFEYYT